MFPYAPESFCRVMLCDGREGQAGAEVGWRILGVTRLSCAWPALCPVSCVL